MKTKKNRWAAIALAALVVAGGTVAAPQAASAATKTCGGDGYSCSTTVQAKSKITIRAIDTSYAKKSKSYTVKTLGGTTMCSGKIVVNGGGKACHLGGYKGKVKITVSKDWFPGMRITTS
ncbi:MAG: hypothetical protein IJG47_05785 [Microbacterium sp.]|nr:hypothetical protein [Microbacterium sp.]